MKILEWLMNSLFYITSLWDKSRDELLNEHRAYERQMLINTAAAIACLIFAIIISPNMEINTAAYIVERYIGFGAFVSGAFFTLLCVWNTVGLIHFRHKYGITD